jgi:signal transduction histidine kinase
VSEAQYSLIASERDRIAKEMHDGLAQTLFSAALAIEVCKHRVGTDPEGVAAQLDETQRLLSESVTELRRYIYDLRPASLDRLGLVGAIESVMDDVSAGGRFRTRLRLEGSERRLAPSAESCLYRVTQEAVQNAVRHGRPSSVTVSLRYADDAVELAVIDDGQGFDVNGAVSKSESGGSLGLQSIRDRVAAQGGRLRIESAGDRGTQVWVRIPC